MAIIIFLNIRSQNESKQILVNVCLLNSTVMELYENAILIFLAMLHTWKIKQLYASVNKKYTKNAFVCMSWAGNSETTTEWGCSPGEVLIKKSWRVSVDKSQSASTL